jgi:hypothetical protein
MAADNLQVTRHEGEGLAIAAFALAQGGDGLGVAGVAGQVKAANAFDGQYPALGQEPTGGRHGVLGAEGGGVQALKVGSSSIAGVAMGARVVGLGVILVLGKVTVALRRQGGRCG